MLQKLRFLAFWKQMLHSTMEVFGQLSLFGKRRQELHCAHRRRIADN